MAYARLFSWDCDVDGHVNKVVCCSYFDTVVSHNLLDAGVLDPGTRPGDRPRGRDSL
jgi:hypothetical protein